MTLNVPPPFDLLFLSDTQIAMPKGHTFVPWAFFLSTHPLERYHLAPAPLRRIRWLRFRFGRGRFHEAADLLCRSSLHIVGDMRIGVERKPGAVVAQHTGQGLHIHAAGEGHRGESMAQIRQMFINTKTERYKKPGSHRKKEFL